MILQVYLTNPFLLRFWGDDSSCEAGCFGWRVKGTRENTGIWMLVDVSNISVAYSFSTCRNIYIYPICSTMSILLNFKGTKMPRVLRKLPFFLRCESNVASSRPNQMCSCLALPSQPLTHKECWESRWARLKGVQWLWTCLSWNLCGTKVVGILRVKLLHSSRVREPSELI